VTINLVGDGLYLTMGGNSRQARQQGADRFMVHADMKGQWMWPRDGVIPGDSNKSWSPMP